MASVNCADSAAIVTTGAITSAIYRLRARKDKEYLGLQYYSPAAGHESQFLNAHLLQVAEAS